MTAALAFYFVSTLTSMAGMSIGALVLLLAMVREFGGPRSFGRALREELSYPGSRLYLAVASFLGFAVIFSLLGAMVAPLTIGDRIAAPRAAELFKLWYLPWPVVIAAALRRVGPGGQARVLRAWLIAFAVVSGIGIVQHFTGWPRPQLIPGTTRYHATVFLGHHLSVASILIFPFFAGVGLFAKGDQSEAVAKLPRGILLPVLILGLITLFLSYSRMLWIALPIGVLLWILWNLPRRIATALGIAILLGVVVASQLPEIRNRFADTYGMTTRLDLWRANWELFKLRPLTGVGLRQNNPLGAALVQSWHPGESIFTGHAHNNFLEMLAGTGLLGTAGWLLWSGLSFVLLWPSARAGSGLARGLFCAWLVFQLNGLTQVNFWEGKVTHQMMLVTALALVARRRKGVA